MTAGPIIIDFETFYSDEYSLKNKDMTTIGYILDPRFEVTGCGISSDTDPNGYFVPGPQVGEHLRILGIEDRAMVSHNIRFDGAILAWHYNIVPKMYIDTLGMARATIYHRTGAASLDACAQFFGLPTKTYGLANAKGLRYADIIADPALYDAYKTYTIQDAKVGRWLFKGLSDLFPRNEYAVLDMIARMAILPQYGLDMGVLQEHYNEQVRKRENLQSKATKIAAHFLPDEQKPKKVIGSAEKFARLLESMGYEPPTKTSPTTGRETYAFAKTDRAFTSLPEENPDDEDLETIVAARLNAKSLQEETRAKRFLSIGSLSWPLTFLRTHAPHLSGATAQGVPPMVFPLKYSGAHTHRFSGEDGLNKQNLGRKSRLRKGLKAPRRYKIVKADASQIEARLNAGLAGDTALLDVFRRREDPYAIMASQIYRIPGLTKESHPKERQVGKVAVLALGYGMSPPRFVATCWAQDRMTIELGFAQMVVHTYRAGFGNRIAIMWQVADSWLGVCATQRLAPVTCPFTRALARMGCATGWDSEMDGVYIRLPSGLRLNYANLTFNAAARQTTYTYGKVTKRIYGAKLIENVVQALARCVVMDAAVRVRYERGIEFLPLGQAHDELIYCVPEYLAEFVGQEVAQEMSRQPVWAGIDLPLAAEYGIGDNYLDCK